MDEMDDVGEELHSILIDSGADASILPLSLLDRGYAVPGVAGKLTGPQGSEIPIESVRDNGSEVEGHHWENDLFERKSSSIKQGISTNHQFWDIFSKEDGRLMAVNRRLLTVLAPKWNENHFLQSHTIANLIAISACGFHGVHSIMCFHSVRSACWQSHLHLPAITELRFLFLHQ